MSRIGNKVIDVPSVVEIKLDGNKISVKGPKGELQRELHKDMIVKIEENTIIVERPSEAQEFKALHGLTRTLINNMILGVTTGFEKVLEINGVGYRAQKQGKKLVLNLGYSHPVEFEEKDGITIEVPAPNKIIVKGSDKEAVGQLAAVIREKRLPEPYRGKGIKYENEVIIRKEGKTGKK